MGVPIQQVMNYFYLEDHPFDPTLDRRIHFNFRQNNAFLTKPLDVFRVRELDNYFSKVGSFGSAIAAVTTFLGGLGNVDQGLPPVILIEGEKGSGSNSMASYVAYLIRKQCHDEPTLLSIPDVQSENPAKVLLQAKRMVAIHIKQQSIAGCDAILDEFREEFREKTPDEGDLNGFFANLAPILGSARLLVLIVDAISWTRLDWITRLHSCLSPLNVALIFLTDDAKVTVQFEGWIRKGDIAPGHTVRLTGLDCTEGRTLLEERMEKFRQQGCPPDKAGLFPYEKVAFEQVFQGYPQKRVVIKKLLEHCKWAMNIKVGEISKANAASPGVPPASPFICWEHFTTGLAQTIGAASSSGYSGTSPRRPGDP